MKINLNNTEKKKLILSLRRNVRVVIGGISGGFAFYLILGILKDTTSIPAMIGKSFIAIVLISFLIIYISFLETKYM